MSSQNESRLVVVPYPIDGQDEERELFAQDPDTKPIHLQEREDDLEGRRELRYQVVDVTNVWITFIILLTFAQFIARIFDAGLEVEEFIGVVVTTTCGLFGLWRVVGKSLYPSDTPKVKKMLDKSD